MTKIKLCGLRFPEDIEKANALHPDYVGFVFAEKSRRYVSPEQAASLRAALLPCIKTVGVFTDEPIAHMLKLSENGVIDVIQLHGHEPDEVIFTLKQQTEKPVWKAFAVTSEEDIERINRSPADLVLLDSPGGGTGTAFQWNLLNRVTRPYILAGGLNKDNISEALRFLCPFGVDVSSGIETDGKKDPDKMADFVSAVRKEETYDK